MLAEGHEIDRFIVEEKLGEGGMAVVYRVRHATLGTRHALKVLSLTSRDVRDRLIQEGRVQATLRHPNVVGVTDVLDVQGAPGLLMELIQGPALDHWLYNYRPTLQESLAIFRGIVAGVGHAHGKGLIHRDLKPANIMLHVDDHGVHPKVTDFGLAKLSENGDLKRTRTGTTMGTPAYMAPEQIRDASSVDRRADLYSLGCILYELVCGRTPFGDDDIIALFGKVAAGDFTPPRELVPDLPQPVVDCIEGLIEVRREHRLTDCASVLEILDGTSRESLTSAVALDGGASELATPRAMPEPGVTSLLLHSAAGDAARMFLREVITKPPTPQEKFGSLAPRDAATPRRVMPAEEPEVTTGALKIAQRPEPRPGVARAATGFFLFGFAAFMAVTLLGLVITAVVLLLASDAGVSASQLPPDPAPVVVPVPIPVAPQPAPAPEPVPATAPEPGTATAPEPATSPGPAPAPVAPGPVATPTPSPRPAPAGEPTPRPAKARTGTVGVVPAGTVIRLVGADGAVYVPGQAIPAGRYDLHGDFPEHEPNAGAGTVTVVAGEEVTLRCNATMAKCK